MVRATQIGPRRVNTNTEKKGGNKGKGRIRGERRKKERRRKE